MKRLALFSTILTLALAIIAITALAQSEAAPMAPAQEARVRVVHGIPDAPPVDVYVDGAKAFGGAAFKGVTDYASLPNGDYLVQVVVSGTTDLSAAVFSQTLTLSDTDYTVIAMGTLTTTDTYDAHLHVYEDNNAAPVMGKAHVRFIHASPDAPAVDIAVTDGPVLFEDIEFMEDGGYVPVLAGEYELEVRPTGTMTAVLTATVMLDPNNIYTVFAMGLAGGDPALEAVPALDQGYNRVRAFHGVSDAPAVDILVDGAPAFENVAYKDISKYAVLPAGTYELGVAPAGLPTAIYTESIDLLGGADLTVAAAGTLTDTDMYDFELVPLVDNNSPPASGQAHVRFVHLSPDAPAVNVVVAGGSSILFEEVAYKEGGGTYVPVPADTYDLEVRLPPGTNGTLVLPLDQVMLKDGFIYTVFAVGRVTGPGSLVTPLEPVIAIDRAMYKLFLPAISKNFMAP